MSIQQLLFVTQAASGFSITNALEDVFNFSAYGDSSTVASINSRAGCFGRDSNFNYENYVWIVTSDDLRKYTYSGGSWSLTSTTDSPLSNNILGCADNGTHVLLCDSNGNAALYNKSTNTFGSSRTIGGGNAQGASWDGTQWIITGYDIEERVYRVNADNTSTLGFSTVLDGSRKRGNAYDFDLDRHWAFGDGSNDETFAAWDGSSFGTPQDWDDYDSNVTPAMTSSTTTDDGDIFITTAGEKFLVQFDGGTIRVKAKLTDVSSVGIVTSGLTLHFDVSNSSSYSGSGTTLSDLTSNNYDGTLLNGVGYTSSDGGALTFDGTNDYIDISGTSGLNAPRGKSFTFSVWFYLLMHGGYQGIFTKNRSNDRHVGLWLAPNKNLVWGAANGTGNYFQLYNGTALSNNTWYNVACVQTSNTHRKMYVNGSLVVTSTSSFTGSATGTETWRIAQATGTNEYMAGRVSSAFIYDNKALTALEVSRNFNADKSKYGY